MKNKFNRDRFWFHFKIIVLVALTSFLGGSWFGGRNAKDGFELTQYFFDTYDELASHGQVSIDAGGAWAFKDNHVYGFGRVQHLGDLAPGQSKKINLVIPQDSIKVKP